MPRLRESTIEDHRAAVRDAILEAAVELARTRGLPAVTMSEIAEKAGIGRATLYRYFPDVEAVLTAWHDRHVAAHLDRMTALGHQAGSPRERLIDVLEAFALIAHHRGRHEADLRSLLHAAVPREQEQHLTALVRGLIENAAESGDVRSDVPADELARFCLRALDAAGDLQEETAVQRLVSVIVDGLRPPTWR